MQRDKIWPSFVFAATAESITFMCWLADANPKMTTSMLAISLAAEMYALKKSMPFFYEVYKNSRDILDFNSRLGIPMVSDFFKRTRRSLMPDDKVLAEALVDALTSVSSPQSETPDTVEPKSMCRIS